MGSATESQAGGDPAGEPGELDFAGGTIRYLSGGSGPPLLFLHAAGGAGAWLDAHAIWARDHHVIAPDHPGFGRSDELEEVEGVDDLAYHYLEVLDRLGIERAAVVGASFGGWIAAELAVLAPERVSALALLSPVGLRIPEHPVADIFLMTPPRLVEALFAEPPPPDPAAEEFDVEAILDAYRDMAALARFAWGAPFMSNPKLERRLHRVSAPTLVLWPEQDRIVPRAHAERYAERIPGARLETLPDCGHALYFERPEDVAGAVSRFLAATPTHGGQS